MVNATTQSTAPQASTPTQTRVAIVDESADPEEKLEREQVHKLHVAQYYFPKIVVIMLILQGLYAMYSSINFMFFKMPRLDTQLATHQITQAEVNHLANQAILMTISTILSLFFALKITVIQSSIAQHLSIILAVILVVGNTQISHLLTALGTNQLVTQLVIDSFRSMFTF